MRLFMGISAFLALSGCITTGTGILPAGPDTYTLSERFGFISGGANEAERVALPKANEFCAQKGRQFVPINMGQTNPSEYGPLGFAVTFKCLQTGDPAIKSYQLEAAPNLVIEQRNR